MDTALWIGYDIFVFAVGYWLVERKLTRREKWTIGIVVLIGLAVAAFGGHSEYQQTAQIEFLQKTVAHAQSDCSDTHTSVSNFQAALGQYLDVESDPNATPNQKKVALSRLSETVALSATITARGSIAGEVVVRDKTGKIVQISPLTTPAPTPSPSR
jgi:glucan phosphoethanolaminetransferase (alkaline phosphatase superfamily)